MGTEGQLQPWHGVAVLVFVSPRLGQGQGMPASYWSHLPVTAASVGAETGVAQRWETREEMPGQARP